MDSASSDFEELLAYFHKHGVRAIVVGGHALAFHGHPRFTKDLDIFIEASRENAVRILAALADFGFGDVGLSVEDFSRSGPIIQLGIPPNRIDLLTAIDGVTFEEAWAGRVPGGFGEQTVNYIGRAEFLRNKRLTGRPQDLADIDALDSGG